MLFMVNPSDTYGFRPVLLHVTVLMQTDEEIGPGGWGSVLRYAEHTKEFTGANTATSSEDLTLWALAESLEALTHPVRVEVYAGNILRADVAGSGGDAEMRERLKVQLARHDVVWHWAMPEVFTDDDRRTEALAMEVGDQASQQLRAELDQRVTIDKALDRFLSEQHERLSKRTFAEYKRVLSYLRSYLNDYASEHPDSGTFCSTYGPEEIGSNLGGFFGIYMAKVIDTRRVLKVAGTVIKSLARWLGEQDLGLSPAEIASMIERAEEASQDLPNADRLAELWNIACDESCQCEEYVTDTWEYFAWIDAVSPGLIKLSNLNRIIEVAVPEEVSALARTGWEVWLEGEKAHGEWHITAVGRIFT